jgi:hypothetical protein
MMDGSSQREDQQLRSSNLAVHGDRMELRY